MGVIETNIAHYKVFKKTCPKCGAEIPLFAENGKYNFCPAVTTDKRIIDVCIKCKMNEVVKKWRNP